MDTIQKQMLVSFISRYKLGGMVNSVLLTCENNTLFTEFMSADTTVIGRVTMDNFKTDFPTVGIYDTETFVKYLNVLNNDIQFSVKTDAATNTPEAFTLSDSSTNIEYLLSNISIIKAAPDTAINQLPNVKIKLEKEFVSKFIKACSLFSNIEMFTFKHDSINGKYYIELNSGGQRSNKIRFDVEAETDGTPHENISFPTKQIKEILNANKDMLDGSFNIFYGGIINVNVNSAIENSTYSCNYYVGAGSKS
ncbi:hypothetical protein [Microcystis phage Mel-JY01]